MFLLVLGGCASKYYQVTPEVYRERVKVLGVLPIMVDAESTILHPQRQEIIDLLQQSARDKYLRLSEQLGASAGYSAVRPVIIDVPSQLAAYCRQDPQERQEWRHLSQLSDGAGRGHCSGA